MKTAKESLKKSLEELEEIQLKRESEKTKEEDENRRVKLSVKLGFCPECGAELIREDLERLNLPKKILFGLFKQRWYRWDSRTICPIDKSHYEYKYEADYSCDLGY